MKTKRYLLAALLCCFLFTSCVTVAENPISEAKKSAADERMFGVWSAVAENGDVNYLHIGAEPEQTIRSANPTTAPGLMRCWLVNHHAESRQVRNPFGVRFFTSQVGKSRFGNMVLPFEGDDQSKQTTYQFFRYEVGERELTVWGIDWQAVSDAVEGGRIKGEVSQEGRFKKVLITDTTANLARFLGEGGDLVLFPEKNKTVYKRID